ncbi:MULTISPECIES: sulfurtransferase [unclassified Rathayibacter]|uniref:sulfurtransferase n=1 Tax=unclassified Rathayibacter TaxID=2609250 RepID=UPI00188D2548|nr:MULTISPECIES: rhodanese-like domain-containing protein [unclassified Rathayibacter]MBF4462824.1 sulfurtransferase [Rathayibacter sp. VKM Ac-2879]MBF4504238.1 sulfurtransferase [Rathayibacter sp. VKM Ac-2878]
MNSSSSSLLSRPVVSTQWLADHLGRDGLVVVDASVLLVPGFDGRPGYLTGDEQYLVEGHVPGAVFGDLLAQLSDDYASLPFSRLSPDRFASAVGALGIDDDSTVVVYDSAVGQWASRLWWLLRAAGHESVAVLDGGLTAWRREARPLETGHVAPTARPGITVRAERPVWVDKTEVERIVRGEAPGALVCAVPPREFTGEAGHRPRLGHLPGSRSVPAARLVDRESNTLLPPERLRELFGDALSAERIVLYCAGGIAATADALALAVLGVETAVVYDGSLNEWAADPDAPLVITAA